MAFRSGIMAEIAGKVTFVNKWPMLLKATQDDENPTPGYLYKEIADLSHESARNCQCLIDFLVERLDKNSCHVKFKVLKLMQHLVEHGHEAFSIGLRCKSKGIQEATTHSGPPHPLHGMAPYASVRKTAKDLSERLFDTEITTRRSTCQTVLTTEGSKKMTGFGNAPISSKQKPLTVDGIGESMKEGLQHIVNKLSGENKSSLSVNQSDSGYKPLYGVDSVSFHDQLSGRKGLIDSRHSESLLRRIRLNDYTPVGIHNDKEIQVNYADPGMAPTSSTQTVTSALVFSGEPEEHDELDCLVLECEGNTSNGSKGSDKLSAGSCDLSERLASVSVADWSQEVLAVEFFISSHHVNHTPSKDEWQKFVKMSSSLNCEKIIELLTSNLHSSKCSQLHCLFGIEGILKGDLISSDVALTLLTSHLMPLQSSQDRAVRAKALKILRQLEKLEAETGLDEPVNEGSYVAQISSQQSSDSYPMGSLFSGMKLAGNATVHHEESSFELMCNESRILEKTSPSHHVQSELDDLLLSINQHRKADSLHKMRDGPTSTHCVQNGRKPTHDSLGSVGVHQMNVAYNREQVDTQRECKLDSDLDPLMSRQAGFTDLWSSLSLDQSPGIKNTAQLKSSKNISSARSEGNPLKNPVQHMTSQQIAFFYPQLSSSVLSGSSSIPLNLARKPTTGFGFVSNADDTETQRMSSNDAFSFVQDAMKIPKN